MQQGLDVHVTVAPVAAGVGLRAGDDAYLPAGGRHDAEIFRRLPRDLHISVILERSAVHAQVSSSRARLVASKERLDDPVPVILGGDVVEGLLNHLHSLGAPNADATLLGQYSAEVFGLGLLNAQKGEVPAHVDVGSLAAPGTPELGERPRPVRDCVLDRRPWRGGVYVDKGIMERLLHRKGRRSRRGRRRGRGDAHEQRQGILAGCGGGLGGVSAVRGVGGLGKEGALALALAVAEETEDGGVGVIRTAIKGGAGVA